LQKALPIPIGQARGSRIGNTFTDSSRRFWPARTPQTTIFFFPRTGTLNEPLLLVLNPRATLKNSQAEFAFADRAMRSPANSKGVQIVRFFDANPIESTL
jgi:hypothetical protein